jgi:hypothetical protein
MRPETEGGMNTVSADLAKIRSAPCYVREHNSVVEWNSALVRIVLKAAVKGSGGDAVKPAS